MQKLPDELIEKFLSGNCTKEEAALVWNYLRENPDESYLQKEFEQADGETVLPQGYKEEMLSYIADRTSGEKPVRHLKLFWYGAAAVITLVICKIWMLDRPAMKASGEHLAVAESPKIEWITKTNTERNRYFSRGLLHAAPAASPIRPAG